MTQIIDAKYFLKTISGEFTLQRQHRGIIREHMERIEIFLELFSKPAD